MNPILVLYATREGQTGRIASYIGSCLQKQGLCPEIVDAKQAPDVFPLDRYHAAIVCASVHGGKHEREIVKFVKRHRTGLEHIPAAFLSVSLSEAGVENPASSEAARDAAAADVQTMIERFIRETGWHPLTTKGVAGALLYSRYNFLLRFIMKGIAKRAGGSTDTSKDTEYTDWKGLDRFVEDFTQSLAKPGATITAG